MDQVEIYTKEEEYFENTIINDGLVKLNQKMREEPRNGRSRREYGLWCSRKQKLEKIGDQERLDKLMGRVKFDHLDEESKKNIFPMIQEFQDVFFIEGDDLTYTDGATHEIETTSNIPINKRQYRFPEATKNI